MSRPVDVLAVMDSAATLLVWSDEQLSAELSQSRAAVAELVSAAEGVAFFAFEPKDMVRLRAAIAKFGGAA